MDIYKTVIIGVFSGVLTSAFIFLCINIFNKILIPWYRSMIYSGIDISGEWKETVVHEGATDISTYQLNQKERAVYGTKTIVKQYKTKDKCETKVLKLEGNFIDGHLLLTATSKSKKIQSLSTYLLKIGKGGSALIGQANWVDSGTGNIRTRDISLYRENS
ncbi:MAG: hypothetical protein AB9Q20_07375 [Candidatus Reddybacter sp.]